MIVVGIDPGTGVKSPLGFVVFDYNSRDVLLTRGIWAEKGHTNQATKLQGFRRSVMSELAALDVKPDLVAIEAFVMRGKGGETLQRLIGAVLTALPPDVKIIEVQNSTVKKEVGGGGGADKGQVAQGVAQWLAENPDSETLANSLISSKQWDILDALAIGITGGKKEAR